MPYIDFADLKRQVSIEQAAELLGLQLKKEKTQLRGSCPSCNAGGDRALAITPDRGLFYCFPSKSGGDCLALVQHITGVDLQEAAQFLLPQELTVPAPNAPKKETAPKRDTTFDPAAFGAKLAYTPEVEALGITQEDAERLGIGFYAGAGMMRGRVCFPVRNEDGSVAGFIGARGSDLKVPKTWLPPSNVVKLRRA
jgi:DNA primase